MPKSAFSDSMPYVMKYLMIGLRTLHYEKPPLRKAEVSLMNQSAESAFGLKIRSLVLLSFCYGQFLGKLLLRAGY